MRDYLIQPTKGNSMSLISAPGLYTSNDIRQAYHNDPCPAPSLSRSLAQTLYFRTPGHAKAQHPLLNPNYEHTSNSKFDLGSAVHTLLLKTGTDVEVLDFKDWRTKEAREERDLLRSQGKAVLLTHEYNAAIEMCDAVWAQLDTMKLQHLLDANIGGSEVVAAAQYGDQKSWARCMVDRLLPDGNLVDIKTTSIALGPETVGKHCASMFYDVQDAFYKRVLDLADPINEKREMIFLFVETKYPYAVMPVVLPGDAQARGEMIVDKALERWEYCMGRDQWPMFEADGIQRAEYPGWAVAEYADVDLDG
jgi:hypothetical protein